MDEVGLGNDRTGSLGAMTWFLGFLLPTSPCLKTGFHAQLPLYET